MILDTFYNQKQGGAFQLVASEVSDPSDSAKRLEAVAKRAATGIDSATARAFDLSIVHEPIKPQKQKPEYALTFAIAENHADPKAQFALHASSNQRQDQINAVGVLNNPHVESLNFQDALNAELKMQMETDIRFGQNENIHVKGEAGRNSKFTQELKNHPKAKQCYEEISNGNNYQHACHKMIILAHTPNYFKHTITHKDLTNSEKYYSIVNQIRKAAEIYFETEYNRSTSFNISGDGQVTVAGEADYFRRAMNLYIDAADGKLLIKDIPIPRGLPGVISLYSPIHFYERVLNSYTKHQFKRK